MSNEQPPVREVIPYKQGKRQSTFRKLNIDFSGTALEQAIALQEQASLKSTKQIDSDLYDHSPPVTTTPHQSPPLPTSHHHTSTTAPNKDFNRRANSIERDALPTGAFPGASKKVYDALYLRTRGAIVPKRLVQASRRDLLEWTSIRNLKTLDNHIKYLMAVGLIIRHWELGSNEGSSYEVVLPEERLNQSPPLPTTGYDSPPLPTSQKMGSGYTQKMGSGGEGQTDEIKDTYAFGKTINTDDDDYTHTAQEMIKVFVVGVRDVTDGEPVDSEQERERWREVGQILADELRSASSRTETISSVPAFFAAHLRRLIARKGHVEKAKEEKHIAPTKKSHQREVQTKRAANTEIKSKFSLEECRRYAEQLRSKGEGINNPGGYATSIHRTGEADAFIEKLLNQPAPLKTVDASQCPDCKGSGWWYPQGEGSGVAKCKHDKLETIPEQKQPPN